MSIATQTPAQRLQRLEDIEAIKGLKHIYCHLADRGYEGAGEGYEDLAALFVEGGIWHPSTQEPVVGRNAIAAECRRFFPLGYHMVMDPAVEVDGDHATGTWWGLIALGREDDAYWIAGRYHDDFVRTSDGWRFAKLYFAAAFYTPYSEGWGQTRFLGSTGSVSAQ
jgi:hypothetical protein